MRVSQALEEVSQVYVPGVVQFYDKQTPDPWQAMHDELEQIIGIQDEAIVSAACLRFVARAKELVERFKRDSTPSKSYSYADAFHSSGEVQSDNDWSVRKKRCVVCSGKDNLTLETVGKDALQVRIICKTCRTEAA